MIISYDNVDFVVDAEAWDNFIKNVNKGFYRSGEYQVLTEENIEPLLEQYTQGFYKGFNEFDEILKNSLSVLSEDKQIAVTRLVEFSKQLGGLPVTGVSVDSTGNNGFLFIEDDSWFAGAVKAGYIYKSWITIANSAPAFVEAFKLDAYYFEFYSNLHKTLKQRKIKPDIQKSLRSIIKSCKSLKQEAEIKAEISSFKNVNNNPVYLIARDKLIGLHDRLNGTIFECSLLEFLSLFDAKDMRESKIDFPKGKIGHFYYMLYEMYEVRQAAIEELNQDKSKLLEFFLTKVKGNLKAFQNRKVHYGRHISFKEDVKIALK